MLNKEDLIEIYNELSKLQRYNITRYSRKRLSKKDFIQENDRIKRLLNKIKKII